MRMDGMREFFREVGIFAVIVPMYMAVFVLVQMLILRMTAVMLMIVVITFAAVLMLVAVTVSMVMSMVVMLMMVLVHMLIFAGHDIVVDMELRQVRIAVAHDDPKHVRLVRQVARACAVANGLNDHRRQAGAEFVHQAGDDSCASRGSHFQSIFRVCDRQPFHHFKCGGSRYGINAVVAVNDAGA